MAGFKRVPFRSLVAGTACGPRHIPVLLSLALDGPMSVSELAERLGVTLTTASLLGTELERSGLVVRHEDETDRRRTILSIAEDYRSVFADWTKSKSNPLRRTLDRLTPAERAAFVKAMAMLDEELASMRDT